MTIAALTRLAGMGNLPAMTQSSPASASLLRIARYPVKGLTGQPLDQSIRSTSMTRRVFTSSVGLVRGRRTSTA